MNYVTHLYLHLGKDTQANMLKLCLAILGTIQVVVPAILMYLQVTKHDEAEIKIAQLKASAHAKAKHKHKKHHKKWCFECKLIQLCCPLPRWTRNQYWVLTVTSVLFFCFTFIYNYYVNSYE